MHYPRCRALITILSISAPIVLSSCSPDLQRKSIWKSAANRSGIAIAYPADSTLFPPEIVAPVVRWTDKNPRANAWLAAVTFAWRSRPEIIVDAPGCSWQPDPEQWRLMKARSVDTPLRITIIGYRRGVAARALSASSVSIATSRDPVGAPLFYREVNLPFSDAVKDPSRIRWRFGSIAGPQQPPVVLQNLPVCGNCHSFSREGSVLGMDVDYANDKGSYAIAEMGREIILDTSKIITWSDYRRQDGQATYGLLSQVSPDGRYVVSTVKDRSVFVPFPDLMFSQLFFPVKGILAVYDRNARRFSPLPGADDRAFVQSNASWSPDGREILFIRAPAYELKTKSDQVLLTPDEVREFAIERKRFAFDLYRIPFNDGRGGKALPVVGASDNGMSNYFARYTPDGKWIVFCQAKSYSLLQADSRLFIMPAAGGAPRLMRCNTPRMNSWHSFSPNGRWMVFSTKVNGPYTQLALTHLDEQGRDTPPVLLTHLTAPDRAANIPEFVNCKADAVEHIVERFLDKKSWSRAASAFLDQDDPAGAEVSYRRALAIAPHDPVILTNLGLMLLMQGKPDQAVVYLRQALTYDPKNRHARMNMGAALDRLNNLDSAEIWYKAALAVDPKYAKACFNLGNIYDARGNHDQAIAWYRKAISIDTLLPEPHYNLSLVYGAQGRIDEAIAECKDALRRKPGFAEAENNLGVLYEHEGKINEAVRHYQEAIGQRPGFKEAQANLERAQGKMPR
jgi:tetratricopeptide (TPR) repeat protein